MGHNSRCFHLGCSECWLVDWLVVFIILHCLRLRQEAGLWVFSLHGMLGQQVETLVQTPFRRCDVGARRPAVWFSPCKARWASRLKLCSRLRSLGVTSVRVD